MDPRILRRSAEELAGNNDYDGWAGSGARGDDDWCKETSMISLEKILVPVDFSEPSKKAVSYGLTLAAESNASLVLAHIVPQSTALMYAFPTRLREICSRGISP
jgi:Universal stress protein family